MNENIRAKMILIISMVIWGTIGIFRRHIAIGSGALAMWRGLIGMLCMIVLLSYKKEFDLKSIKKNAVVLCVTGTMIGVNWILLFEAYRYTTVAVATLCYYMAPTLVILVSPLLLKEKLTGKKLICVVVSLCGMVCISGVLQGGMAGGTQNARGVLFGLGAAVLYAGVVLANKKISGISAYNKTFVQLGIAGIVLIPYTILVEGANNEPIGISMILLIILLGVIHTGIAYAMYFASMEKVPAQTVALFSYIDPIVAILLSALLLREPMGMIEWIGTILILAGTIASEMI